MTKKITINAPDPITVNAARHLDETEGALKAGITVNIVDRAAINQVLRYIAMAHSASAEETAEHHVVDGVKYLCHTGDHYCPAEAHRLALSDALGLGTGAPWDAIRERAAELHNASVSPLQICELPHESIGEEDECERQRLARDSALLKQTLTQAILDLKLPLPAHNHGDFDDGLEAAIETVAQVFDTLE